jgi:hypothetical protein
VAFTDGEACEVASVAAAVDAAAVDSLVVTPVCIGPALLKFLAPTDSPFANPITAMATKAQPPTAAKTTRNRTARRFDPA